VFDETSEFGARAALRLREDSAIWLTTVAPDGTPQPTPVWFLYDGSKSVLIYSQPNQAKLRNIAHNGRASLNLDGNRHGGNIVVCHGDIVISDDPAVDQAPAYLEKLKQASGVEILDPDLKAMEMAVEAAASNSPAMTPEK